MKSQSAQRATEKPVCYNTRFDRKTYELAMQVARARGMDLADYIRELIRRDLARLSFLPIEDRKAFGPVIDEGKEIFPVVLREGDRERIARAASNAGMFPQEWVQSAIRRSIQRSEDMKNKEVGA